MLQSDGGNYCASVNAATLAVIDAGIPMKDFVCACSASYLGDSPIVDINYMEESSGSPEIIVSVLPKSEQIVFLEMNGRLHEDNLSKVVDMAVKGCKDVYGVLDRTVREHVSEVGTSLETWSNFHNHLLVVIKAFQKKHLSAVTVADDLCLGDVHVHESVWSLLQQICHQNASLFIATSEQKDNKGTHKKNTKSMCS